jgi:hypothetical protein
VPAGQRLDLVVAEPGGGDHAGVARDVTVVGHRGQRQLLVARHPDLAHHQHVERRPQRRGHFGGDRHAAPGQPEHDDVAAGEVGQPGR